MRSRWRLLLGAIAWTFGGCIGPEQLAQAMGYSPLTPPSRAYQPGTILWVRERFRPNVADAGVICTTRASLGAHYAAKRRELPLAATEMSRYVARLSARAMAAVREDARFADIAHVTIELTDLAVLSVSPEAVRAHAAWRDPACARAMAHRRAQGMATSMVARALSVRAHYRVRFVSGAPRDPTYRWRLLEHLAPLFNLAASDVVGPGDIIGHALSWGIQDDAALVGIGAYSDADQVRRHEPIRLRDDALVVARTAPDVP